MNTAVIKTGGKQYLVQEGQKLRVEKIKSDLEDKITFEEVLITSSGKDTTVGTPFVEGAKVEGKIVDHARHKKVTGVKMKSKKRSKKYFGHKQHYTEVEITKISA